MLSGQRDTDAQCADEHVTGLVYSLFGQRSTGQGSASRAHQRLAGRGESDGPGSADVEQRAEFAFEGSDRVDRPDCTMSSRLAGRVMLRFLDQRQEVT